jgi:hypothetical protein
MEYSESFYLLNFDVEICGDAVDGWRYLVRRRFPVRGAPWFCDYWQTSQSTSLNGTRREVESLIRFYDYWHPCWAGLNATQSWIKDCDKF